MTARGAGASQLAILADGPAEDQAAVLVLGAEGQAAGPAAWRLAALLDAGFLAAAGWDPVTRVLAPPPGHRLIRRDCGRLDIPASRNAHARREAPPPVLGPGKCAVVACLRPSRARRGRHEAYCRVHAPRWEAASQADPLLDEQRWRQAAEPLPVPGQLNLRGLPPLVVVEVLYGVQQRTAAQCTSYCRFLRRLARELRRAGVCSLADLPAQDEPVLRSLVNSLLAHLGRAFADPRTEITKDRWDLTVLGHHGWLCLHRHQPARASPPSAGPLTTCRGGAASKQAPGCTRSSARWRGCHRRCGPAAPIMARIPLPSAAPTSRRSCTGWRSWPPTGAVRDAVSRPARTPGGCGRDPRAGADPSRRSGQRPGRRLHPGGRRRPRQGGPRRAGP